MYNQKVKIQGQPLLRACPNHASNNQTKQVLALISNLGWLWQTPSWNCMSQVEAEKYVLKLYS